MTPKTIRIALVDPRDVVRAGFKLLLENTACMQVVGEAGQGEAACEQYAAWRADIIVLDISLPGIGGVETLRRLRRQDKKAKVLVLSACEDLSHPRRVLRAGAAGYLSKRAAPQELVDAVRKVEAGQIVLDPHLANLLFTAANTEASVLDRLSEREFDYFLGLIRGLSICQLATQMGVSEWTAGCHLRHIKRKLRVESQSEMALLALREGVAAL